MQTGRDLKEFQPEIPRAFRQHSSDDILPTIHNAQSVRCSVFGKTYDVQRMLTSRHVAHGLRRAIAPHGIPGRADLRA